MKTINASSEIINPYKINGLNILKDIEMVGRTCYKSEDKITEESAVKFVKMLIDNGHEAMIEHNAISVKFICDRGVSHELVRHRVASFAQESTRYCNYSKDKFGNDITFIIPNWLDSLQLGEHNSLKICNEYYDIPLEREFESQELQELTYLWSLATSEIAYLKLIETGWQPQQARSVLPNSLKTELVMTGFVSDWEHFFKLRCAQSAHPQARELAVPLEEYFKQNNIL